MQMAVNGSLQFLAEDQMWTKYLFYSTSVSLLISINRNPVLEGTCTKET